jgi:cephalosporin-C deacetylase
MALFDLPLAQLEEYTPEVAEPPDFDEFWSQTLSAAAGFEPLIAVEPVATGLSSVDTWDVTFAGFDGQPVRAWYSRPAGTAGAALPAVVEYLGYGRGRGFPFERLMWPCAGYAHLLMDSRGQGSQGGSGGHTPDPVGSESAAPGFLTRGIRDPKQAYLRRLQTDAARAVDAVAVLPGVDDRRIAVAGNSQGGGLAIAAAGLNSRAAAIIASVPFLCHFQRNIEITDTHPYAEIVQYLSVNRDATDRVLRSLAYFDGVNFARRTSAPALFAVGLRDTVCPPSGVYAAFNALGTLGGRPLTADAEMVVYPFNHHEGGEAFQSARQLSWLRDRFLTPDGLIGRVPAGPPELAGHPG